jgi:antitoxin (DNA-binding transcriptional repressor) of toxin-antitoxin stability system
MKTITIRDLRHKWPQAERQLLEEGEWLVTRDSKPVAKLVKVTEKKPRKRFSAKDHAKWMRSVFGDEPPKHSVDESLAEARAERDLI